MPWLRLKSKCSDLGRVSTTCDSGWVYSRYANLHLILNANGLTHPLSQMALTRSSIPSNLSR